MDKEIYYKDYVECYKKIVDIIELLRNFLYPRKYEFTKIEDRDLNLEEKIDYIKNDLANMTFTDEIGYEFTQLLQLYFPVKKANLEENYKTMMSYVYPKLDGLYNNLKEKYLPFLKLMTIFEYPDQTKKYSDEMIWEISLKDEKIIENIRRKTDDIIWIGMDGNLEMIDDFLKEAYFLSDIEFERYMSGEKNNLSSISVKDNGDKINVDFKLFDKYFEDIYGQDDSIEHIKKVLKRNILFYNAENINDNDKKTPGALATFMFYGPTGTGKTEVAKLIANFVFGSKKNLLLLDMNSYKDSKIAASSIKGHPEGYVDSDKGTDFTRFLANNNKGVIVLDEFEKADKSVREIFMTMLDEGEFKDALGNVYDLSSYIFIATTNASEKIEHKASKMGFGNFDKKEEIKEQEKEIKNALREIFTSPIMNRFNNLIHFKKIEYDDALLISENIINKLCNSFSNKRFGKITPKIRIDNIKEVSKIVLKECNFEKDGVRSLKNVINDTIGSEIIEQILEGNDNIVINCVNDKIVVKKVMKNMR